MRFFSGWRRQLPPKRIAFALVIEAGRLEIQSRRLIASLRQFGGRWKKAPLYVYQPRAGAELAPETLDFLQKNECHFTALDLNRTWAEWGLFNRPYACAHLEAALGEETDFLVFLDSDILLLKEPAGLCLTDDKWLGIKPVDVMNIASPANGPLDEYWRRIYAVAGDPLEAGATVFPSVGEVPIRPYFNGGVIVSRPRIRLFHAWMQNAEKMAAHKAWWKGLPQPQHYHIAQAVLSATITAQTPMERVELLPPGLNYPLNVQHLLPESKRWARLDRVTLLHYKESFHDAEWTRKIAVSAAQRRWLQRQEIPV